MGRLPQAWSEMPPGLGDRGRRKLERVNAEIEMHRRIIDDERHHHDRMARKLSGAPPTTRRARRLTKQRDRSAAAVQASMNRLTKLDRRRRRLAARWAR